MRILPVERNMMKIEFESFLREFDKKYNLKRIRPKLSIDLPVELFFNRSLPAFAPKVYGTLKYLQVGKKPIRVSHQELIKLTGLSKHTITKTLKKLKENEFLEIEFCSGDTNIYYFPQKI